MEVQTPGNGQILEENGTAQSNVYGKCGSGDATIFQTTLQPFYGSLDFVRDNPGEPVPEGTFRHLLNFLVQNEDNTGRCTNNLDGLPPDPD